MKEDLCKALDEKAEDYLAGDLSLEEKAMLDEHLAVCPSCRNMLIQAESLDRHLAALREEPPAALLDGVMAGIRREKKKRPLTYLSKLLPMAACLALVVSVVLLFPSIASQQKGENAALDRLPNMVTTDKPSSDADDGDKTEADVPAVSDEINESPVETETMAEEAVSDTAANEEPDTEAAVVTDPWWAERPSTDAPRETASPTGTRPPASTAPPTTDAPATDAPVIEAPDEEETDVSGDASVPSENDTVASPETEAEQVPATEWVETQAPSSESEADDETDASAENGGEESRSSLLGALFLAIHIALILAAVGAAALIVLLLLRLCRKGK